MSTKPPIDYAKNKVLKRKGRRTCKHTAIELDEIDYWYKLSPEERDYMEKFMYEYYQADFGPSDNIHNPELRQDCYRRNNAAKSQWHSVGEDKLVEAARKAVDKPHYYNPKDYDK